MRRALMVSVSIGLLAWMSAGCTDTGDPVDELWGAAEALREDVEEGAEQVPFCLALARMAAAVESGSPETAAEAAEEALARAPEELLETTRNVTESLREARDAGEGVRGPGLEDDVHELVDTATGVCDPR